MTYTLRPYQEEVVNRMVADRHKPGNSLVVVAQGLGKSVIIAELANRLNEEVLILVPTRELLLQNLEKLEAFVEQKDVGVYSAGVNRKERGKYTIATIQSAYRHPEVFRGIKVVLFDECFVGGTKIDGKNIEDIRPGEMIWSFNHKTNRIEKKKVLSVQKRKVKKTLYCVGVDGCFIISTPNHPYYVEGKGYTETKNIKNGDVLYAIQREIVTSSNNTTLQTVSETSNNSIKISGKTIPPKGATPLLRKMSNVNFSSSWSYGYKREKALSRKEKTNKQNPQNDWTQTTHTRWKRNGNDSTRRNAYEGTWKWLESLCFWNRGQMENGISKKLQNRFSKSIPYGSNRVGWRKPPLNRSSETGREERKIFRRVRVDSIKILEQGSDERFTNGKKYDYVYNLEVEDNHNYFVEGVLVHNCSLLSPDKEGMYYQLFNAIGVQKVYGLTASPWRQTIVYNRPGGWAGYTGAKWQRIRQLEAITTTKMITRFRPYRGKWFWSRVLAIINVDKATKMGYLTPLKYIDDSLVVHEQLKLNKSRSDFDLDYFEQLCNNYTKLVDYINKIEQKKILVFCSSIEQATKLAELGHYFVVTADTKAKERKQIIEQFRTVKRGVLCGVNVFSYGFDVPDLEAIVLLRPTRSLALHSQVLGRLTRLTDGKEFGYVYDLVGNIRSMGRLETIKTTYIDGKLNVVSETKPQGWHLVPLFTWNINQKQKDKNELR